MINSKELLQPLEHQVETHLMLAIKVFQNMDDVLLSTPAVDGGWSIAQCLWHLNSYGDFYLPLIQQAIEKQASKSFSSGWFGSYFIKMMNPLTGKRKYKAFHKHDPPAKPDAHETIANFIEQQERLLLLLRKADQADLNTRLPISISPLLKLKLGDVLGFIVAHDERHMQQAQRVI